MYKGIFWLIGGELLNVKVTCNESGSAIQKVQYSSKSGENFNHKAEWEQIPHKITKSKPYNYYPRGRVEIKNGKATVYLNPALNIDEITEIIKAEFGLSDIKTVFKSDGSEHYQAVGEK